MNYLDAIPHARCTKCKKKFLQLFGGSTTCIRCRYTSEIYKPIPKSNHEHRLERECLLCGAEYVAASGTAKWCSDRCKEKGGWRRKRKTVSLRDYKKQQKMAKRNRSVSTAKSGHLSPDTPADPAK